MFEVTNGAKRGFSEKNGLPDGPHQVTGRFTGGKRSVLVVPLIGMEILPLSNSTITRESGAPAEARISAWFAIATR